MASNRKAKRSNGTLKEFVPLYDIEAAINVMKQFVGCAYEDIIQLDEGIKIRFRDVGHLLGSASIEVWAEEDGEARKDGIFRRYRKYEQADCEKSAVYVRCGLRCYGIYLW